MKTILLAGYRTSENQEEPLGLERTYDGQRQLDRQIQQLSQLGLEVICVLAGEHADAQLRVCPRIANTELIYDTNEPLNLASNLKAGLAACQKELVFALPVEIPTPDALLWRSLQQTWHKADLRSVHIVQATDAEGAPWQFGFPLLITPAGCERIRSLNSFRNLLDPRLNYLHMNCSNESSLAPTAKDI